jgi:predicted nucleic acid-binding protein
MVILIDTNVILDSVLERESFVNEADEIITKCYDKEIFGYIAGYTVPTVFYIVRKQFSVSETKKILSRLCGFLEIVGIDKYQVIKSIEDKDFSDLEDCLQTECAKAVNADYIVTRNTDDFTASSVPAILPEDFLKKLDNRGCSKMSNFGTATL